MDLITWSAPLTIDPNAITTTASLTLPLLFAGPAYNRMIIVLHRNPLNRFWLFCMLAKNNASIPDAARHKTADFWNIV